MQQIEEFSKWILKVRDESINGSNDSESEIDIP